MIGRKHGMYEYIEKDFGFSRVWITFRWDEGNAFEVEITDYH